MSNAKKSGFTLIEAVVSVALVGVGVVSTLNALSAIGKSDSQVRLRERMQRLAIDKCDELIATGALTNATQSGDFKDRNLDGYIWQATVTPGSVTNLDSIQVIVSQSDDPNGITEEVDTLRYTPPATTTVPATATTTGGGR